MELKKKQGKVEIVTGLYMVVVLAILSAVQVQVNLYMAASGFMEDALAASNLASAVIDIREYGLSHMIQISDPEQAYSVYKEALKENLQLDDEWQGSNTDLISGTVRIEEYIVYNVREEDITVYSFETDGRCNIREERGGVGTVRTPDGTIVEATSVYSRIGFPVNGVLGVTIYARKDNTVDIVRNISEENGGV